MIKIIKLNKYNENKLLGASLFLNAGLIKSFVDANATHLSVEIEEVAEGILIRPLEAITLPM